MTRTEKKKKITIGVVFEQSLIGWLDRKAAQNDTSRSRIIRKIVREAKQAEESEKK